MNTGGGWSMKGVGWWTAMAELTLKEMETVQRAIGIVEGVSFGVSGEVASALVVAVEMLDSVFGGDGK